MHFTRYLRYFRNVLPLLVVSKAAFRLCKLELRISEGFGRDCEGNDDMLARGCILYGMYSTFVMSSHFLLPQTSICRFCKLELPEPWFDQHSGSSSSSSTTSRSSSSRGVMVSWPSECSFIKIFSNQSLAASAVKQCTSGIPPCRYSILQVDTSYV